MNVIVHCHANTNYNFFTEMRENSEFNSSGTLFFFFFNGVYLFIIQMNGMIVDENYEMPAKIVQVVK